MAPPRVKHPLLDDAVLLADAYAAATIASIAEQVGVSTTTVRRALVRHGVDRLPRSRNTRPPTAQVLDDPSWLAEQYRARTGVDIAAELGVTPTTVYAAMARHAIARRPSSRTLALRRPELADRDWLHAAADRTSSRQTAAQLDVSAGAVTDAYRRAGIDPSVTTRLYARGHSRQRPTADALQAMWEHEGTFRGVSAHLGCAPTTAAVWLAEAGIFADTPPALSRITLHVAIRDGWPLSKIAAETGVSVMTVRVELHRHQLFDAHRTRHRLRRVSPTRA